MATDHATQEHQQSHEGPAAANLTPPNARSPVRMVVEHFEKLTVQANTSPVSPSRAVISTFVPVGSSRPTPSPSTTAAIYSTAAASHFTHPVSSSLPADSDSASAGSISASTGAISTPANSPSTPAHTSSSTFNASAAVSTASPESPNASSDTPVSHLSTPFISPKTPTKFIEESIADAMDTQPIFPKRKLVSVRRISSIEKIPGYSSRLLHIDGWTVIDKDRDHKV